MILNEIMIIHMDHSAYSAIYVIIGLGNNSEFVNFKFYSYLTSVESFIRPFVYNAYGSLLYYKPLLSHKADLGSTIFYYILFYIVLS